MSSSRAKLNFTRLLQVEMLYQRYFLRTNQSHMVHLLVLLCILFTCMAIAVLLSDYETQVQCSLLLLCCILIYLGKSGIYRVHGTWPVSRTQWWRKLGNIFGTPSRVLQSSQTRVLYLFPTTYFFWYLYFLSTCDRLILVRVQLYLTSKTLKNICT